MPAAVSRRLPQAPKTGRFGSRMTPPTAVAGHSSSPDKNVPVPRSLADIQRQLFSVLPLPRVSKSKLRASPKLHTSLESVPSPETSPPPPPPPPITDLDESSGDEACEGFPTPPPPPSTVGVGAAHGSRAGWPSLRTFTAANPMMDGAGAVPHGQPARDETDAERPAAADVDKIPKRMFRRRASILRIARRWKCTVEDAIEMCRNFEEAQGSSD
mmetsp:Transcript_7600/g.19605  ORF Transcript_7600/g.19605 Transcript_7600/m.19605 type:complete len:214 (-) Transcript_7600:197-838(-)